MYMYVSSFVLLRYPASKILVSGLYMYVPFLDIDLAKSYSVGALVS